MGRILVITNDFPPRCGGIETFIFALCARLPADELVVLTSSTPGGAAFDATLDFAVVRHRAAMLLPTPATARLAERILRDHDCDRVLFGAAAPLGLLAARLRQAGAQRVVALTHGHEPGWAGVPLVRRALRRVADDCDALTYVSEFCRARLEPALSAPARHRLHPLMPGADTDLFRPGCGGSRLRERLGIAPDRPVVLSASRLVARKGQDQLIHAMPAIARAVPDALLLVVGTGPQRAQLERLAQRVGAHRQVRFIGEVPWDEMPAWYDSADVFVGPSRTRWAGIEPEALGIVYLEAQATGCPVIVGRSGGAPETVRHGITGYVVDPRDPSDIARRTVDLLSDPARRRRFGEAARTWAQTEWSWQRAAEQIGALLVDPRGKSTYVRLP
ncbi:MAG: glycosyltransferase family 4 protein [Actinomycetota bacterium]